MRVTVFTSNHPRHLYLIERLSEVTQDLWVVQECATLFPGKTSDIFHRSDVMEKYFSHVVAAERKVFGEVRFLPSSLASLSLRMGELSSVSLDVLAPALESDLYVTFGASFIRGPLIDFLLQKRGINIHMGVSPYYRGNSCNFWPLFDEKPEYVGATVHMLTKGLDSGPILAHVFSKEVGESSFEFGMRSVAAAHNAVIDLIETGRIASLQAVPQERSREIRYSRRADFTDEIAQRYLDAPISKSEIVKAVALRDLESFVNPVVI